MMNDNANGIDWNEPPYVQPPARTTSTFFPRYLHNLDVWLNNVQPYVELN